MVKHMIIRKIKDECENKEIVKENVKRELEALAGKIKGLIEMHIITAALPSSSGDLSSQGLSEASPSSARCKHLCKTEYVPEVVA